MGLFDWFNRSKQISLEESDRELIYQLFGSFDANGLILGNSNTLLNESYEKNTDVYSIINKIITVSRSIPWIVEKKVGDVWEIDTNNTIVPLLENPNKTKKYTWNDIEEQTLLYLLATGNTYLYGNTRINKNLIEELDVLPTSAVCIETNNDFFNPLYEYYFKFNSVQKKLDNNYVAHLKYFNPSYCTLTESAYGLSPIQVAAQVIRVGNDTWDASAALFQNRGAIGLITDKSQRPMQPEEAKEVQKDFNRQTAGTNNYGKIKVTNKDLSYIQMAMTSQDLQLIEKGVVNLRSLCNVYNLDSSLFNDPANKTYNNRLEAEKSMYSNCIIPLSDKMSEMYTRFIAWNHYPDKTYRIKQDFNEVECLQSDKKSEAEKDKIVIEGIALIMGMNISQEAKVSMIKEMYEISDETLSVLTKQPIPPSNEQ